MWRITPSACRSPPCFLCSSRRWLHCLLRKRLPLACSHASPRQLLPLFPSLPPATRVSTSFVVRLASFVVYRPFRLLGLIAGNRCPCFTREGSLPASGESAAGESPRTLPQGHDVGSSWQHTLLNSSHHGDCFLLSYGESPAGPVRGSGANRDHA